MFRVLHLSDVHITSANASVVSDRIGALASHVATHLPVHLVAFTGDATLSAQADHFNLFWKRVIEPLLQACSLPPERFVIVPGNHDVDRKRVDKYREMGLHQALSNPDEADGIWRDPELRDAALKRVETFFAWAKALGLQTQSTVIHADGKSVGVACLNSAWLSHKDGEKQDIAITRAQTMECEELIGEADVKLALAHHPLDWLQTRDGVRIREHLFANFDAYLQGHMHEGDGTQISTPRGSAMSLQAPAIHSPKCFPGYQLYEFNLSERLLTFHSYRLLEEQLR